jgi:hypothetical protein
MKRLLTATLLIGLLGIACGKDAKKLVVAAETYAEASCACKEAKCLETAANQYAYDSKKLIAEKGPPSDEQAEKISAATKSAVECTTKLTAKFAADAANR